jgi:ATP-binding cassette subfamily A (ABC1) protein 1
MAFAFFPASVAIFVTKEREVSAKHQQLISGVSVQAYWLSNYAFDLLSFIVPATGSILLTSAFGITQFTSSDASRLAAFVTVFALYGASVAPFTYCMTYLFKDHSTAQNVSLIVGIVALVLMIAALIMSQVASSCRADQVLRFVWRLLPAFCLGNSLVSLSFLDQLPLIDATCDAYQGVFKPISEYVPYDAFDMRATGWNIAFMAVEAPLYLALAILIDVALANPHVRLVLAGGGPGGARRVLALARAFFTSATTVTTVAEEAAAAPAATDPEEDADVAAERARVAASALLPASAAADVVQLQSLRKVYASSGKVAVRSLSFGLEVGDVFGFLGINGAGKTTTLQMLSGDVLPSAGTAFICGFDILREQEQVRRCLGYCPQWDALLENNTVREHLELYARIKGLPEEEVAGVVQAAIAQMDLGAFANKLAQSLSGGNKRKLSVAIALVGDPPVVFLDEPSTGMDPVARRFMWSVIARVATERKQCSIILTTHSMEEVEALCSRIGIMVGGRLRCLGTSQHLKHRHSAGLVTELRLAPPDAASKGIAALAARTGLTRGGHVARRDLARIAAAAGAPADEVSEAGTGWALHAQFEASTRPSPESAPADREVDAAAVLLWCAEEAAVARLAERAGEAFSGATLAERQGLLVRYKLPAASDAPLAAQFARLEQLRRPYDEGGAGVESYTLSQMSLEDVFVSFASQQEEETNVARGYR